MMDDEPLEDETMPRPKTPQSSRYFLAACWLAAALAIPANADWLITLDGRMIETHGPWTIDGERLTYVDLEGVEHTIALDQIDLEGSEETTSLRAGESYEPLPPTAESEPPAAKKRARKNKKSKIVLYVGAMCRTCTRARELLEELEVDFEILDVDSSVRARRTYEKKAGHGGGLPIIDIDGKVIYTFHPGVVRRKIGTFLEKEKKQEQEEEETPTPTAAPPPDRPESP